MNEQKLSEIIKAFAYGMTAEQVAQVEEITVEEAENLLAHNQEAIEHKRAELKEAGHCNE